MAGPLRLANSRPPFPSYTETLRPSPPLEAWLADTVRQIASVKLWRQVIMDENPRAH